MLTLGPLGFTAPWLLLGLIALPVLWILLRAVPPAPIRRRFPGVALLLGLTDDEARVRPHPLVAAAAAAGSLSLRSSSDLPGPILNPQDTRAATGPLLIVADGTWADARDWQARTDRIGALLDRCRPCRADRGRRDADRPACRWSRIPVGRDRGARPAEHLGPPPWAPDTAALDDFRRCADRDASIPSGCRTDWHGTAAHLCWRHWNAMAA